MMIDALIPVFADGLHLDPKFCNARDLHKALKVGRDFSNWIKGRIRKYGFVEGVDYFPVSGNACSPDLASKKSQLDSPNRANQVAHGGDRKTIDYRLTLDMAKELAMVENNEIGRNVRRYFIRVEEEMRAELRAMASHALSLPGVAGRARDGLRLKETLVLQNQSIEMMERLATETRPEVRRNLWRVLKQINDALGIPTDPLE